jgi:hypothetical protein
MAFSTCIPVLELGVGNIIWLSRILYKKIKPNFAMNQVFIDSMSQVSTRVLRHSYNSLLRCSLLCLTPYAPVSRPHSTLLLEPRFDPPFLVIISETYFHYLDLLEETIDLGPLALLE